LPLRARLALFGAGVVALALVLFGALFYALLAHGVATNQDDALRSRAQTAVRSLNSSSDLAARSPIAPADLRTSTDVFVEVFDPAWSTIYSSAELNGSPPPVALGLRDRVAQGAGGSFDTEGGLRLYALPFAQGFVVTGQSTKVLQSNLSGIATFLVVSAVPALLAAWLASWLVAGRALAPLKAVAGTADEIGRTRDFGRRLSAPGAADEVALLAASFNRMLDQLREAFESQRRFVADASHELRTPLSTIQGNAGLLARGPEVGEDVRRAAAADIAAESARMARLVDRMLSLARADAGLELGLAPVDLKGVVEEVARQAIAVHSERTMRVECLEATVNGDADALRQLVWILLDNAVRHSLSTVEVSLRVEQAWARLVVGDDGAGIAVDDRESVFERFFRADPARSGGRAGLGLSIAKWIVEQHGGRIMAGSSIAGGAALLVDLPIPAGRARP
jgi:signal transduction histidine kinase